MKPLLLVLLLTLTACAQNEGNDCGISATGKGPARLVAFGDSQTAGTETCAYSYANTLAVRHNLKLINRAVGGSAFVSADQHGRIMSFQFRATDRVIFSVGFNDMSRYTDAVYMTEFKARLKQAIEFTAPQVETLSIGTAFKPFDWRYSDAADLALYRQTVRDAVAELGYANVTVGDVGDAVAGDPAFYTADTWHYNMTGQVALADDFETIF